MADIEWNKKELNSGREDSGVSNIEGINGTENGIKQGYQHGSLTEGLVAYYPTERGKGQIIRDGALNELGRVVGSPVWETDSPIGEYLLNFDGQNDEVKTLEIPYHPSDTTYTIAAWARADHFDSERIVQFTKEGTGTGYSIYATEGERFAFWHNDGSNRQIETSTKDVEKWYHIVGLYNGEKMKVYVNGEQENSKNVGSGSRDVDSFGFGSSGLGWGYFNGSITDIRIYSRALSEPEIQALYNLASPSGVLMEKKDIPSEADGGVSRWKFDDDSDTATDSWGENTGHIDGAQYVSDRIYGDNALEFNGRDGRMDIHHDNSLNIVDELSISVWVKTVESDGFVLNKSGALGNFWVGSGGHEPTGGMRWELRLSEGAESVTTSYPVTDGEWRHYTGTYDGEKIVLYVNGQIEDVTHVEDDINNSNETMTIGYRDPDSPERHLDGIIDDLRIYNKSLSPVEAEKLFKKQSYRINRADLLQ